MKSVEARDVVNAACVVFVGMGEEDAVQFLYLLAKHLLAEIGAAINDESFVAVRCPPEGRPTPDRCTTTRVAPMRPSRCRVVFAGAAAQPLKRGLRFDRNAATPSLNSALPKAIACATASRSKKSSTLAS